MADFPKLFTFPDTLINLSTMGVNSVFATYSGNSIQTSHAWFGANLAVYIPFRIASPISITTLFLLNGLTASGNLDIGIYSSDGTRLTSTGSTAQAATSAIQSVSITPIELTSGLYYFALAMNGTSATIMNNASGTIALAKMFGCAQQATAFPLPATATFATYGQLQIPIFGATARSFI